MTESERRMVQIAGKRTVSLRNQAITLIDVPKGAVLHQKQVNECNRDLTSTTSRRRPAPYNRIEESRVTTARWFIERLVRPPVVLVGSTVERVCDFFFRERDIRVSKAEEERRKQSNIGGLPEGFRVQRIGIAAAKSISELPASEIAKYFREHPEIARALLGESYDKRFTPSSFIEEKGNGFRVGWLTRDAKYECVQEFSNLADASTDYLLFSLGKGRWTPHK